MVLKPKKIVWSIIAILCVLGLIFIWFIGLPVPDFVATDDGHAPKTYTIRIAPYTYFDVGMSSADKLVRTDYETYYDFETSGVAKTQTQIRADLVNGQKNVFGRPNNLLYRVFDNCTIQVNSDSSIIQAYNTLINNEPYRVEGYFDQLKPSKEKLPTYTSTNPDFIRDIAPGFYGADLRPYSYDDEQKSLLYLDEDGGYMRVTTVFGVQYDVINQLLSMAKACYKLDITEYWAGDDFVLFTSGDWVLGVRYINRNTQRVVVSNTTFNRCPALKTIIAG